MKFPRRYGSTSLLISCPRLAHQARRLHLVVTTRITSPDRRFSTAWRSSQPQRVEQPLSVRELKLAGVVGSDRRGERPPLLENFSPESLTLSLRSPWSSADVLCIPVLFHLPFLQSCLALHPTESKGARCRCASRHVSQWVR